MENLRRHISAGKACPSNCFLEGLLASARKRRSIFIGQSSKQAAGRRIETFSNIVFIHIPLIHTDFNLKLFTIPKYSHMLHCGALQVSTWPSSTKFATRSVLAVGEMCMKQFRIPSFEIRLLGAFEKIAFFYFHPALPILAC